jgi:hypothetical protein
MKTTPARSNARLSARTVSNIGLPRPCSYRSIVGALTPLSFARRARDQSSKARPARQVSGSSFSLINQRYSAREVGQIANAVIEHDSAHDEQRRAQRGRFKTMLRKLEARFIRTGRTRRARLDGELSKILQA